MPEMCIALRAGYCCSFHSQTIVGTGADILFGNGGPKAGPACAGFEFCVGVEQCIITANAAVDAFVVQVPVLSAVSSFCTCPSRDLKFIGGELLHPFGVCLDDFGYLGRAQFLAGVVEQDDGDWAIIFIVSLSCG